MFKEIVDALGLEEKNLNHQLMQLHTERVVTISRLKLKQVDVIEDDNYRGKVDTEEMAAAQMSLIGDAFDIVEAGEVVEVILVRTKEISP
ncbi:hypothetical protein ACLOJK_018090 [Asimina triloba]